MMEGHVVRQRNIRQMHIKTGEDSEPKRSQPLNKQKDKGRERIGDEYIDKQKRVGKYCRV